MPATATLKPRDLRETQGTESYCAFDMLEVDPADERYRRVNSRASARS